MSAGKRFAQKLVRASQRFGQQTDLFETSEVRGGVSNAAIRRHPCHLQLPALRLPERLDRAAIEVLKEVELSPDVLARRAVALNNILWQRPLPQESIQRKMLLRKFHQSQLPSDESPEAMEEFNRFMVVDKRTISKHISKELADWQPLRYSPSLAPIYLTSRLAPNFAIACRVLYEVRKRCPDFSPTSHFDFGSGLGTALWAASSVWPEAVFRERVMVDTSPSMLNLAERLQRDGSTSAHVEGAFPNVFSRQFLSASPQPTFDLVTSCNTLIDLGLGEARRMALEALWRKTGSFLVIAEQGTAAGFKAVLEARDFLIQNFGAEVVEEKEAAHLFAPCPHTSSCPKQDSICNFYVSYKKFNLTSSREDFAKELFSYVIFTKGPQHFGPSLPRIISYKPKKTKAFVLHDICSTNGTAERVAFSKKNASKSLYSMMSKAVAGDMVPCDMEISELDGSDSVDPENS